ncbi:MAG: hypothetical protein V7K27_28525 [Nostoc sp.]|uniref:hypothetical protein n=1 Tax=Nostoc sp. TaxID=1180 RepID=UPI002FF7E58A
MNQRKYSSEQLLRCDEDGIEYFTVKKTGLSGMSHRGLARFVGKDHTAIIYWVERVEKADLVENNLPEYLKAFAGKDVKLVNYKDPQGRSILEDRFCAALTEYFASDAQDAKNNLKAQQSRILIRDIGMRQLIHLKTGWYLQCNDEQFRKLLQEHEQRVKTRNLLKDKIRCDLMRAVNEWREVHRQSRAIFSDTHDEINKMLQGLSSKEIKLKNSLPKHVLIRDFYDTQPLNDYSAISRVTTTLIKCGIYPLESVRLASALYLSPEHIAEAIPLMDNIRKVGKFLAEQKSKRLNETIDFNPSLTNLNAKS